MLLKSIWENASCLNNPYENKLFFLELKKQRIQEYDYTKVNLRYKKTSDKIKLFFEKVLLSFLSLNSSYKKKIHQAFVSISNIKESSSGISHNISKVHGVAQSVLSQQTGGIENSDNHSTTSISPAQDPRNEFFLKNLIDNYYLILEKPNEKGFGNGIVKRESGNWSSCYVTNDLSCNSLSLYCVILANEDDLTANSRMKRIPFAETAIVDNDLLVKAREQVLYPEKTASEYAQQAKILQRVAELRAEEEALLNKEPLFVEDIL